MRKVFSIRFKILGLIACSLVAAAIGVVLLAHTRLQTVIDGSQRIVYEEKVGTIIHQLKDKVARLHMTGRKNVYEEAFKASILKKLRHTYYAAEDMRIYPFIIDTNGMCVMHPVFKRGEDSLAGREYIQKMLAVRDGEFDYEYEAGERKWCVVKSFPEWNWIVGYAVPLEIKYADVRALRNMLVVVIFGTIGVVLILLFVFISRMLYPIVKLTAASKAIGAGNLDQGVEIKSRDELGVLAGNFVQMRDAIKQQIAQLNSEITERKKAEDALKKHKDHLEELVKERTAELSRANQAKSDFLANMSHELRTPLNVIMGYSQLLQKKILSPTEQREYINTINRNGEHLLAMINDVLEISKIEAKQLTVENATFDLQTLFHNLEKAFASSLDTKGLSFEIIGVDQVPRYVTTDEHKLHQVLVNILGNAVKFTEKGGISVRVAVKNETTDTMRLAVEVQDTGIGIAEGEQDKVFAYLEQTAGGRDKKTGTGLGMAISRDYVRLMGGDISVTSKEGEGSTFCFEIPIKKGRIEDSKPQISKHCVTGLRPGQKVPRVLVVEDERDSRALLVKLLKTAGFEVEEAVNGKEAVEMFNQSHPDFIWMDIRMPVMDGREATRCIKNTEAGQSTVVVALTAHALKEERDMVLAAGLDDFVRKPFREQEVFEVMAKHLGVEYVYEEKPVDSDAELENAVQVTTQQLVSLPADIRNQLHQAAVELDDGRILTIIEQLKPHDALMAGALQTIVNKLEFRRLLDLLQGG